MWNYVYFCAIAILFYVHITMVIIIQSKQFIKLYYGTRNIPWFCLVNLLKVSGKLQWRVQNWGLTINAIHLNVGPYPLPVFSLRNGWIRPWAVRSCKWVFHLSLCCTLITYIFFWLYKHIVNLHFLASICHKWFWVWDDPAPETPRTASIKSTQTPCL